MITECIPFDAKINAVRKKIMMLKLSPFPLIAEDVNNVDKSIGKIFDVISFIESREIEK